MRVLMLGWEFPPFISGGLGTACQGLTKAMTSCGTRIMFVLPTAQTAGEPAGRCVAPPTSEQSPPGLTILPVISRITSPYGPSMAEVDPGRAAVEAAADARKVELMEEGGLRVVGTGCGGGYDGNLAARIGEYTRRCLEKVAGEEFDVIHAHDWVTFTAGRALARQSGKPLVVHVHSTEFDRSGEQVNQAVYEIERAGMQAASAVIAVSNLTARIVADRYGVSEEKIRVVYNGLEQDGPVPPRQTLRPGEQVVLFLGRITMQKGPEFFVRAAQRVLQRQQRVRFVVAGWGDMGPRMMDHVASLGLGRHVHFTGFLRGADVGQAYSVSDVYVMPSVSEPFGLTALEAVRHGAAVVMSKTSGVAEVMHQGVLKVDFWDVDGMATKITALLQRPAMAEEMRRKAREELKSLTWERAADRCMSVYRRDLGCPC